MILFLIGLTLIICKDKPMIQIHEDPFFKDDIPDINLYLENPFDPKSIPVIGKTTEEDILKFYSNKPNARKSYKKFETRKIKSKVCEYNRKIHFRQLSRDSVSGEGFTGYSGKEYIYFWVYLKNGIVSCYTIKHLVMGKNGEWQKGKYDTNTEDVSHAQLDEEFYVYWSQRSQKDRDKYGVKSFDVGNKPWPKEAE